MKNSCLLLIAIFFTINFSYAQWATSGNNIYNNNSGNVGIWTTNPTAALQVGEFNGRANNQLLIPGTYNFEQVRLGQISNGNAALEFVNHSGGAASYGIKFLVDVDHGAPGLQLQYAPAASAYSSLSYTTGLYMNLGGAIGIGTTDTYGYKLAVNGSAIATSITVKMFANWPDYVFKPAYRLPALQEVKTYIDHYHHLPEMPSEQEVAKDGINLGEMNRLLTKKVEELTLYLIDIKKENETLRQTQKAINQKLKRHHIN